MILRGVQSMDWGILLGVVGVLAIPLALATLGLTMVATTRGEFNFVRGCFVAAALVSAITVFLLYWYYREGSLPMRAIFAAIAGAVIFGGLATALNWVDRKELPSPTAVPEKLTMPHTPEENERRKVLVTKLRDQYYADHPTPWPQPQEVMANINSQLAAAHESFRAVVPSDPANAMIPEEAGPRIKKTFMQSTNANIYNENVEVIGFDTVIDATGGSVINKNFKAVAPGTMPPDKKHK